MLRRRDSYPEVKAMGNEPQSREHEQEDEVRELSDDELDEVAGGSAMASTHLPPA